MYTRLVIFFLTLVSLLLISCSKVTNLSFLQKTLEYNDSGGSKMASPDIEKYRGMVDVYNGTQIVPIAGMYLQTQLLLSNSTYLNILPSGTTTISTPFNYNFPPIGCDNMKNAISRCIKVSLADPDIYESDDYLNGVTEADNDIIRKHVLCVEYFKRVEQYLDADVNLDGAISTADITLIRTAITFNTPLTFAPWHFIEPSILQYYQTQLDKNGFLTSTELITLESKISDRQFYPFIYNNTGADLIKNFRAFKPGDVNFDANLLNLDIK